MTLNHHLKRAMQSLSSVALCLSDLLSHLRCERLSQPQTAATPGFNTAEGQNALFNLTTGLGNTAVGLVFALKQH